LSSNIHVVPVYHLKTVIQGPINIITSGYATWFMAGGAICIAHYDITDDVITRKL